MTKLVLEYVTGGTDLPNILVVLKRQHRPGWEPQYTTASPPYLLQGDEPQWVLQGCRIPHKHAVDVG